MAERRGRALRMAAAGAMELTWLYAAAAFIFDVNGLARFPLGGAALIFSLASVLGVVLAGRGLRVVHVIAAHVAGFLLTASAALHAFGRWTEPGRPWTDPRWLAGLRRVSGLDEWATLILALACCAAFWASGVALARRPLSGARVSARFDIGLGVLCAIVSICWAAQVVSPAARLLVPSYFLFGILAMALARLGGDGSRAYSAGFAETGVALSFGVIAVLLAAAVIPLLPLLEAAAQAGYGVLRTAAVFVWPWVLALLRFLFSFWAPRPAEPAPPPQLSDSFLRALEERATRSGPMQVVLMWMMVALVCGAAAVVAGWALWRLALFLLSRTPGSPRRRASSWAALLRRLRAILAALLGLLRRRTAAAGVTAFARLDRWGRRSGVGRQRGETPLEYARRLSRCFPAVAAEIESTVQAFAGELYGGRVLNRRETLELRRWRRSLASPRHWPARLRKRLAPE